MFIAAQYILYHTSQDTTRDQETQHLTNLAHFFKFWSAVDHISCQQGVNPRNYHPIDVPPLISAMQRWDKIVMQRRDQTQLAGKTFFVANIASIAMIVIIAMVKSYQGGGGLSLQIWRGLQLNGDIGEHLRGGHSGTGAKSSLFVICHPTQASLYLFLYVFQSRKMLLQALVQKALLVTLLDLIAGFHQLSKSIVHVHSWRRRHHIEVFFLDILLEGENECEIMCEI